MTERDANQAPSAEPTTPDARSAPHEPAPDERVDPDAPGATLINEDEDAVEPNEPG